MTSARSKGAAAPRSRLAEEFPSYEAARQIYSVLVMHYQEGLKQSEIAELTKLSKVKVNRLIKQGREMGMVEMSIRSPFQSLFDLEARFRSATDVEDVRITPAASGDPETVLQQVGAAAANLLLERINDGDTIAITGGKGVTSVIEGLAPERAYDVKVVPATGGVQGKHYTDVNHVAARMAEKLGGRAFQIHAPLFAETREQREMLLAMRSVDEVLERARQADIAVMGIGSILSMESSYYDLNPLSKDDQAELGRVGAAGELLAHLIDAEGALCDYELNSRLVALTPRELQNIPSSIAVASGSNKVIPIGAAIRGGHIKALVVDEATAEGALETLGGEP